MNRTNPVNAGADLQPEPDSTAPMGEALVGCFAEGGSAVNIKQGEVIRLHSSRGGACKLDVGHGAFVDGGQRLAKML